MYRTFGTAAHRMVRQYGYVASFHFSGCRNSSAVDKATNKSRSTSTEVSSKFCSHRRVTAAYGDPVSNLIIVFPGNQCQQTLSCPPKLAAADLSAGEPQALPYENVRNRRMAVRYHAQDRCEACAKRPSPALHRDVFARPRLHLDG
eukprot:scaffold277018_cov20-Prasinocladus_malaysianus.AAC.2